MSNPIHKDPCQVPRLASWPNRMWLPQNIGIKIKSSWHPLLIFFASKKSIILLIKLKPKVLFKPETSGLREVRAVELLQVLFQYFLSQYPGTLPHDFNFLLRQYQLSISQCHPWFLGPSPVHPWRLHPDKIYQPTDSVIIMIIIIIIKHDVCRL